MEDRGGPESDGALESFGKLRCYLECALGCLFAVYWLCPPLPSPVELPEALVLPDQADDPALGGMGGAEPSSVSFHLQIQHVPPRGWSGSPSDVCLGSISGDQLVHRDTAVNTVNSNW